MKVKEGKSLNRIETFCENENIFDIIDIDDKEINEIVTMDIYFKDLLLIPASWVIDITHETDKIYILLPKKMSSSDVMQYAKPLTDKLLVAFNDRIKNENLGT